jgi:choline-sulfatase
MDKPNLLLIMCDQLRADVLGCYGNSLVQTPHIDRLAAEGMVFERAYSQTPVCVPARYGLISGQAPFEVGLLENGKPGNVQFPLPAQLRECGYFSTAVGKMHFSPPRRHFGFDRMYLSEEIPGHFADDDYLQYLRVNGFGDIHEPHGKRSAHYYEPQISPLPKEHHTTAWTAKTACEQLRLNRNRPSFTFCSFIKPHPPFDPCKPYDTLYAENEMPLPVDWKNEKPSGDYLIDVQNDYKVNGVENVSDADVRRIRAAYYGCVTQIDEQIGTILDTLDECGLAENTLVVFTADHGEMLGDHNSFGKRTFYEASARIPFIVRWPKRIKPGHDKNHLMLLQDIYASFITAAGGNVPDISCGKDFLPLCENKTSPWRERITGEIGRDSRMKLMLLEGNLKYIFHCNGGRENLFDLNADPHELNDIAAARPDYCAQCRRELTSFYQQRGLIEALENGTLKVLSEQHHERKGFLNQYPHWPETIMD